MAESRRPGVKLSGEVGLGYPDGFWKTKRVSWVSVGQGTVHMPKCATSILLHQMARAVDRATSFVHTGFLMADGRGEKFAFCVQVFIHSYFAPSNQLM